jgi:hypothetical protein
VARAFAATGGRQHRQIRRHLRADPISDRNKNVGYKLHYGKARSNYRRPMTGRSPLSRPIKAFGAMVNHI